MDETTYELTSSTLDRLLRLQQLLAEGQTGCVLLALNLEEEWSDARPRAPEHTGVLDRVLDPDGADATLRSLDPEIAYIASQLYEMGGQLIQLTDRMPELLAIIERRMQGAT